MCFSIVRIQRNGEHGYANKQDQGYAKQLCYHADSPSRRVAGQHTGRSVCKFMLIAMYQWFWKPKQTNGDAWLYFVSVANNEMRKSTARTAHCYSVAIHVPRARFHDDNVTLKTRLEYLMNN